MYPILTIGLGVFGILFLSLAGLLHATQNAREPPLICSSLPFLSPILGLASRRYKWFLSLHVAHKLPIYTLRLPWIRCYIINDHSLIPSIDRQIRTIAFAPIEAKATAGVLGTSSITNKIMSRDPTSNTGHFITYHKAIRPPLAPGPGLDAMLSRAIRALQQSVCNLQLSGNVSLFQWVRHEVILATAEGDYGPANPFRDPDFENAWYTFLPGVHLLASRVAPSVIANKSFQARELLAERFKRYFREDSHLQGSESLLARTKHGVATGLPAADRARGEVGACMALHNNTVPGAFWLLYHIFSDPIVLKECRRELKQSVFNHGGDLAVEINSIISSCPILLSTMHEVFRYRAIGTVTVRQVLEDHNLNGTYLLKRGSLVLIPNTVQHFNTAIWGSDAGAFNHRRFLEAPNAKGSNTARRYGPASLRAFGGGPLLCPGRHFAIGEILAFAAMMVLRYDIRPVDGRRWKDLKVENSYGLGVAKVFLLPENDIEVQIIPKGE